MWRSENRSSRLASVMGPPGVGGPPLSASLQSRLLRAVHGPERFRGGCSYGARLVAGSLALAIVSSVVTPRLLPGCNRLRLGGAVGGEALELVADGAHGGTHLLVALRHHRLHRLGRAGRLRVEVGEDVPGE